MGKRIETFATFALLTDEKVMTGPEVYVNDANRNQRYAFFDAWGRHRVLQGGNGIKDFIELDRASTGEFVASNHKFDPKGTEGMTEYGTHWARYVNYVMWEDDEEEMNKGDKRAQWKNLYKTKFGRMRQNTVEDLEAAMWAPPSEEMETPPSSDVTVPRLPYSIPALLTTDGLSPFNSGTIMGINPSTKPNFRNSYDYWSNFRNDIEDLLFDQFHLTQYFPPAGPASNEFTGNTKDGMVMYADLVTLRELRAILRDSNDRLTELGQYDGEIGYMKVPFRWVPQLGGPDTPNENRRIYAVNFNFLFPICRNGRFMTLHSDRGRAFKPHNMPMSNILYEISEYNWWIRSRRRHFVLSPATT